MFEFYPGLPQVTKATDLIPTPPGGSSEQQQNWAIGTWERWRWPKVAKCPEQPRINSQFLSGLFAGTEPVQIAQCLSLLHSAMVMITASFPGSCARTWERGYDDEECMSQGFNLGGGGEGSLVPRPSNFPPPFQIYKGYLKNTVLGVILQLRFQSRRT